MPAWDLGRPQAASGKALAGTNNRWQERLGYAYDGAGNLNYRTNNVLVQTFTVNALNEIMVEMHDFADLIQQLRLGIGDQNGRLFHPVLPGWVFHFQYSPRIPSKLLSTEKKHKNTVTT